MTRRLTRQQLARPFMLAVIILGAAACLYSAYSLPFAQLDLLFLLLAALTVALTSRITVRVPGVNGRITISETLIFLTMLLYGGEAAILLAAADGLCSSLLISRRPLTLAYNAALVAFTTLITVAVLTFFFAPVHLIPRDPFGAHFIVALSVMALVQYIGNSVLAAVAWAWKTDQPIWQVYKQYCLYTSLTYFAGASAAGLVAKLIGSVGFYAFIAVAPIIAIIYFTYRTYLQNIEVQAAAAKAEAEAAARAEAAASQAEQARRHVEELNHYIAEQERIREQYSQIEKMSALGELASGVAHDFNNTLAGILGRAQLLLTTRDPEKIEAGLKIIIKTAKDGAKTIKRIQDFARQRRPHDFQPVSVDQLLLDVSEITRPRWKDRAEAANVHISLELRIRSNGLVLGDESELREVLVNMVFNAVDAMPQGGTLTLATRDVDDQIEISVSDTGTGMSEDVRARVFNPFFTTKGKTGMGLGLAVSYGIIRRHDGTVEVESELGIGSTFRLRLPAARGGALAATTTAELHAPSGPLPRGARARFLVVDDEEHVRELLSDILARDGHEVVQAQTGREALARCAEAEFDGVFTDLGLPGMSGWELARALRERHPRLPVAVVTGWGEAVGSHEQAAAGVDWVVTKPFTVEQITGIARAAALRRAANNLPDTKPATAAA
ncbi:MAG TPA: ATP-binding protein [Pyrinomonadaceae bacterium]|jgi:signal transduction histidine kinase/CheY-like chemotaxis protein